MFAVGVQTSPKGMLTGGSEITPSVDICGGGVDDSPADTNGSTTAGDDVLERLQDTVTAYEMQVILILYNFQAFLPPNLTRSVCKRR